MELTGIILIILIFAAGVFYFKIPSGLALMFSALAVAIVLTGNPQIRHLVEGSFGFLDAILIVSTAMIFMKVTEESGALGSISYFIVKNLYKFPTILMLLMMLFVMFPGMLTGLSSTCILTTGALISPALIGMGLSKKAAGSFIAMAAVFGMIAPPINIPVMIIGGGVDMPYVGFDIPLLIVSVPPAIFTALYFRFKYVKKIDPVVVLEKIQKKENIRFTAYLPLIFVVGYITLIRVFPRLIPDIGVPLIFVIGTFLAVLFLRKVKFMELSSKAISDVLPIIMILIGVGMLVQVMTLTGIRGTIAATFFKVPMEYLYVLLVLLMPAFGSAYASASIIGVPLVYVFLGHNELLVTAALSLLAGVGDLMPPPSFLCVFASKIVDEDNHYRILKESLIPIIITMVFGLTVIIFSGFLGSAISKLY